MSRRPIAYLAALAVFFLTLPLYADARDLRRIAQLRRTYAGSPAGEWSVCSMRDGARVEGRATVEAATGGAFNLSLTMGRASCHASCTMQGRRLTGSADPTAGIVGALGGSNAAGQRLEIELVLDAVGLEMVGTWRLGDASGPLVLRRDAREIEELLARNRPNEATEVVLDGRTPFHLTVTEQISPVLNADVGRAVTLTPEDALRALDLTDWKYLAYKFEQGKVPGATYADRRRVIERVLANHLESVAGQPFVISQTSFARWLARNGVPVESAGTLTSPLRDIYAIGAGQGVEMRFDSVHKVRIVSTFPGNLAAYMATVDHDYIATAYTKYLRDLAAIPPTEEEAFFRFVLDLLAFSGTEQFESVGPRARSVAIDFAGVLAAEFHRVFGSVPQPVGRGGLTIPFAADMIEITLLSAFTKNGVEPILGDATATDGPARIVSQPGSPVVYWSPDGGLTMRRSDRRMIQRQISDYLKENFDGYDHLTQLIRGRTGDIFLDLATYFHRITRDDVASGQAEEVVALAAEMLAFGTEHADEIQAFIGERVDEANQIFAGSNLPPLSDYRSHTFRSHLTWLSRLDPDAAETLRDGGFDNYLRSRINRSSIKWEIEQSDLAVLRRIRTVAASVIGTEAGRYALAYVVSRLAWTVPADQYGGQALSQEATQRIENRQNPKRRATVEAALEILRLATADPQTLQAIGFSSLASDHLYSAAGVAIDSFDLERRGRAKVVPLAGRLTP